MILIDNRIGSREIAAVIPSTTKTELTRLEYADVSWLGKGPDGPLSIGVERKRISDLISSIDSGRLSGHQLIGLLAAYNKVFIVVEGCWRPNPLNGILEVPCGGRNWKPLQFGQSRCMASKVFNYLHSLAVVCGVGVWLTFDLKETGQWINAIYHWWQKEWDKHQSFYMFHNTPMPAPVVHIGKAPLVARMVKELASEIGWKRANAIARRYPTMFELVMATEKELRTIEGIGKGLAKTIVERLRGEK